MSNSFPRFSRGNRVKKSGEPSKLSNKKVFPYANNQPTYKKEPSQLQEKVEICRLDPHIQQYREPPELFSGAVQARCLHKSYDQDSKEA
jgi:hypothetical protein